ncbi:hypothetical protein Presley_58 [Acinetobacter phage Presley]|uniref:Uncharacterized protein n=1 Tax=Acinetobacter phage Presley TaxID=1406780 RepID=U5PVV9_9CAUD|nr:hypothetical protein Presley_58 [Acinetobacter phage Presley]AGY48125.1 hypothetical protein Presley_58 [Acinetobacter phage Presley]
MSGFEVRNVLGEVIVSDTMKHLGIILEQDITTIDGAVVGTGTTMSNVVMAPSFIKTKYLGYPSLRNTLPDGTITLYKPIEGGEFAGQYWYGENQGKLVFLGEDYQKVSGYLDVYDEQGELLWSANSAKNVPRIVKAYQLDAETLIAGTTVDVGLNPYIIMNSFPSLFAPGPMGTAVRGALFGRYENGKLQLQFKAWGRGGEIHDNFKAFLNGGTLPVYIASFAS